MTEYIKKEDAIEKAAALASAIPLPRTLVELLYDQIPIADVVEVVKCKDCKWYHEIGCAIKIVDESDEPTDNDYCSFGERSDT